MIHYALRCGDGHEFDGWFKSSTSFDDQAGAGLLHCPVCASRRVGRALMAPRIAPRVALTAAAPPAVPIAEDAPNAPPGEALPVMPDRMRAVLQRIRAEVEARCDYVGPNFARVVRGMAENAQPVRAVYGEATAEEAEALAEEGIQVGRIPWVRRADS